ARLVMRALYGAKEAFSTPGPTRWRRPLDVASRAFPRWRGPIPRHTPTEALRDGAVRNWTIARPLACFSRPPASGGCDGESGNPPAQRLEACVAQPARRRPESHRKGGDAEAGGAAAHEVVVLRGSTAAGRIEGSLALPEGLSANPSSRGERRSTESHVPDRRRACSVAWEATRRHAEALRGRGPGSMGGADGARARTGDSKRKSFNGARRTLVEIEDVLEAVHEPVEAGRL